VTRSFRYRARALAYDYAGSAAGLIISSGLLGIAQPAAPVAWVLAAMDALFLVYFVRTACRQWTCIELDQAGIRASGPLGATIRWEDLRSLRLDYYSTRRDREGGWMQLRLEGAHGRIRIDSEVDGFAEIALGAAREAARRGLALDAASAANLEVLG